MLRLPDSLAAWNSPSFAAVLQREIAGLGGAALPLQSCLTATSVALDDKIELMVIGAVEEPDCIRVKVGVFFAGIVAGCSCADDPTPVEPQNEYCELLLTIDKATADATATPAGE